MAIQQQQGQANSNTNAAPVDDTPVGGQPLTEIQQRSLAAGRVLGPLHMPSQGTYQTRGRDMPPPVAPTGGTGAPRGLWGPGIGRRNVPGYPRNQRVEMKQNPAWEQMIKAMRPETQIKQEPAPSTLNGVPTSLANLPPGYADAVPTYDGGPGTYNTGAPAYNPSGSPGGSK
jgi:hypothetical protein